MMIELRVCTGWADGDHVRQEEVPENWESLSKKQKDKYLDECSDEFLRECCEVTARVVENDE